MVGCLLLSALGRRGIGARAVRFFAIWGFLLALGADVGRAQPFNGRHFDVVSYPRDVTEAGTESVAVEVFYPGMVDAESLDGNDLWVVSRNGYDQMARFESARRVYGPGGAKIEATYWIAAPSDGGWSSAANGRYVLLLEPEQVRFGVGNPLPKPGRPEWVSNRFVPPALVGSFQVRIGSRPPLEADVRISQSGRETTADVGLVFPTLGYQVKWGEPTRRGGRYVVRPSVEAPFPITLPATEEQRHEYVFPTPEPGAYEFVVEVDGQALVVEEFVIEPTEPVPADVDIDVEVSPEGLGLATVVIHFLDPYFVLSDPGVPVFSEEDRAFDIQATAQRVVFAQPPEEPAITITQYEFEVPEPGDYVIRFHLNGELKAEREFEFSGGQGAPIPEIVASDIFQVDGGWAVEVEIEPPARSFVSEWGELRRRGNSFSADVHLDWIPIDPLALPPPPEPNRNRYDLGALERGNYSFTLTSGNKTVTRLEFVVGNSTQIGAQLSVGPVIQLGSPAQEMTVTYSSDSPLDLESFGDGDLIVKSWARFADVFPLPVWERREVTLVAVDASSDNRVVDVTYEVAAPDGAWSPESNGRFDVCLVAGEVRTENGATNVERELGSFQVEVESERIPARAEMEIEREDGELYADVEVTFFDFPYHAITDWGHVRRVRDDYYVIDSVAHEVAFLLPPEEPIVQSHRYRIPSGSDVNRPIPFETVEWSEMTDIEEPQNVIVRDFEGWLELLGIPPELAPVVRVAVPVDFNERSLLAVFAGEKPTSGFGIEITGVTERGDHIHVDVVESLPGVISNPVLTYPQHLVSIPKTDLPVRWTKEIIAYPEAPPGEGPSDRPEQRRVDEIDPLEATLEFRINGVTYATDVFTPIFNGPEPEAPELESTRLEARIGDDGACWMDVELEFDDVEDDSGIRIDWGIPEVQRDGAIRVDVIVDGDVNYRENEDDDSVEDEDEGDDDTETIVSHSYALNETRGGVNRFVLYLNGERVDELLFVKSTVEPFDAWLREKLDSMGPDGSGMVRIGDFDGDFMGDFSEWLLGLDAFDPKDDNPISIEFRDGLVFSHLIRDGEYGVDVELEVSEDLKEWKSAGGVCDRIEKVKVNNEFSRVSYCFPANGKGIGAQYGRVRVTRPGR